MVDSVNHLADGPRAGSVRLICCAIADFPPSRMSDVLDLACELIRRRSLTPDDAGCQTLLAGRLEHAGFRVEHLRYGKVDNLWAVHGEGGPTLAFLGHTDVVPSGPETAWRSPPFEPAIADGRLYGRGAADMKGSVAAMTVALERFVAAHPDHPGRVALLLTSDEEGPTNLDGVRRVAAHFRAGGERIDWCVVGEPSARERLGDLIRVGRRGSLSGTLTVRGVQGHVAYPEKALNPIHAFAPALAELAAERWDEGNADFPPTSFQVSNLNAGTGANNVIPGELVALVNFRFCTASRAEDLRARTEAVLRRHGLDFSLDWNLSGEPFLTPPGGRLREVVVAVCRELCGTEPEQSTGGGTSDGRFIAPLGAEVVELGPVNATIHKVDECVDVGDLERLPDLYLAVCERLLG
jgi:succinyl-diaminopimelate desuccinylase